MAKDRQFINLLAVVLAAFKSIYIVSLERRLHSEYVAAGEYAKCELNYEGNDTSLFFFFENQ